MKRPLYSFLAAILFFVVAAAACETQSEGAPFGFFEDTDHPLCPPVAGYIWSPVPAYGDWGNSENYDNYSGPDYGCRAQGADGGEPTYNGDFAPARNPNTESGGVFNAQSGRTSANLVESNLTVFAPVPQTAVQSGGFPNEGNFRVTCQYSHFAKDDSIVKPGDSGGSHLHMFFGNTTTDAFTDVGGDNIEDSGGGSCNGFALNRSAYWIPALLDGDGNAMVPYQILIYYKTKQVDVAGGVQPMPQGLKMVAGNTTGNSFITLNDPSGSSEEDVFWSCGASGSKSNYRTTIPTDCRDRNVNAPDNNNDPTDINATIRFPQCLRPGTLASVDPRNPTHTQRLDDGRNEDCAPGFVRMPELSVLLYWKAPASFDEVADWRLSSDAEGTSTPGGTLHADWIGGWQDSIMNEFVDNCLANVSTNSSQPTGRNCGFGNLGTGRQLKGINPDQWQGPYRVRRSDLPG